MSNIKNIHAVHGTIANVDSILKKKGVPESVRADLRAWLAPLLPKFSVPSVNVRLPQAAGHISAEEFDATMQAIQNALSERARLTAAAFEDAMWLAIDLKVANLMGTPA